MTAIAEVRLWGSRIAAVSMADGDEIATFQYDPAFLASSIEVSPLVMPLRAEPYAFPGLALESFHGLPGLVADSLPDRYGQALIDAWLAGQGRAPESFNAVERLCYVGQRGMGALEFRPSHGPRPTTSHDLEVAALVDLASEVYASRAAARRIARRGPPRAGDARHPQRRHLGRRRARQGGDRVQPGHAGRAVRSGRPRAGVRVLAAEVRRRHGQPRQGHAGGSARLRRDRIRLLADGPRRRHRDDRVPPARGGRPPPLHDPPLRPRPRRREAPHAVARRARPLRLQPRRRPLLRAGVRRHAQPRPARTPRSSSCSAG